MENHAIGGVPVGEKTSNYEKMKNEMAGAFLRYDQEQMIRRFSLKSDAAYLYLTFVGREYRALSRVPANCPEADTTKERHLISLHIR